MKYNHTHCPPDAHDRDPGDDYVPGRDDMPRVDENGLLLCSDCEQSLMWCETYEDYDHADPDTPPCFLVIEYPRPEDIPGL